MENHFQVQQQAKSAIPMSKTNKFKGSSRSRSRSNSNNQYVGVRRRPSGRWVAEIKDTTQKIRMWLGTFETAEEAARAYDEAACLLRGSNTRTNFVTQVSQDSPIASRIRNILNSRKISNHQSVQDASTTRNSSSSTQSNCCVTSSSSSTSSPTRSGNLDSLSCEKTEDSYLFDDAYKPDLSNCSNEFEMGSSQCGMPWGVLDQQGFDHRFPFSHDHDHQVLELPKNVGLPEETADLEFSEFERMKVERQISASLYAMNGVQEYMETVHDPIEALWDLPPLCSLLC